MLIRPFVRSMASDAMPTNLCTPPAAEDWLQVQIIRVSSLHHPSKAVHKIQISASAVYCKQGDRHLLLFCLEFSFLLWCHPESINSNTSDTERI
mmetsp:Transcript_15204/g.22303  ORF Transcript_15204/g.22303 Transcript_15204/m.22303 type:complete len:94 (-) Transcript_15204:1028-1309(-)